MVAASTVALILTVPGQTLGVSTFIDHIIEGLDLDRSRVSGAYFIGTVLASFNAPLVGRLLDRRGVRVVMTVVGVLLAAAVIGMSAVQGMVSLTIGFFCIRLLGQGALSLTASTGIAVWFDERVGRATAISMSVSQATMAMVPLGLTGLIALVGWRWGFAVAGLVVLAIVPVVGWFVAVDRPATLGQVPDGRAATTPEGIAAAAAKPAAGRSLTVPEALRSRGFWLLTGFFAFDSAMFTGIVFHNVSIMESQGLSQTQAAAVFLPFVVTSLLATFTFGELTDRIPHRLLLILCGCAVGTTYFLVTQVAPGVMMIVYSLMLGLQSGSVRALNGALYPKFFGSANIGSIRGVAFLIGGAASGIGPLIVSLGRDITGSYEPLLQGAAVIAVLLGLAASTAPIPRRSEPAPI